MVPAIDLRRNQPHLLEPRGDCLRGAPVCGCHLLDTHAGFKFSTQSGELGLAPGSADILRKVRAPGGAPLGKIERLDAGEERPKDGAPLHDGIGRQRCARIGIHPLHQGLEDFADTSVVHLRSLQCAQSEQI